MRERRKVLAFVSIVVFALTLLPIMTVGAASTEIRIVPASTEVVLNNDCVVYIEVANVTDLYAWEFQFDYDPTILDLTSTSIVSGGLKEPTQTFYSLTNETAGHLWWAVSTTYPNTTGISYAQQYIFEIHFKAISTGTSNLDLHDTILSDSNANAIAHTAVDGSIMVYERDLTVTNINIVNHGCSKYANDTYANGSAYYYPVEVTVHNTGGLAAGEFNVSLEVYWMNGSLVETSAEVPVAGLAAGASVVVNFTSLFHPTHTGHYRLTATVDSQSQVVESNETNNVFVQSDVPVTVIGDVNGNGVVNVLDAVIIAKAWTLSAPPNYSADINHDGTVDSGDGTRIGLHWGETW